MRRGIGKDKAEQSGAGVPSLAVQYAGTRARERENLHVHTGLQVWRAERDRRDSLCAILDNGVTRLLDGSLKGKAPYVASINFLRSLFEMA
jgi:hypothetical protein